jgi:hypothetical protein
MTDTTFIDMAAFYDDESLESAPAAAIANEARVASGAGSTMALSPTEATRAPGTHHSASSC